MAGLLFIVSRAHPALYERLRREFDAEEIMRVVLDRRRDERRRESHGVPQERRRTERREREVAGDPNPLGWAIVPIEAPAAPDTPIPPGTSA